MKTISKKMACIATLMTLGLSSAHAGLVSVSGGPSSTGDFAEIISAPSDVRDDAAFNTAIQGFDERQGVFLDNNLGVDGGMISSGMRVDSHMLFLNSGPNNSSQRIEHGANNNNNAVTFTFTGEILGVMSNSNGSLEVSSSMFLGAVGTAYPGNQFNGRGMENNPLSGDTNNDWYAVTGNSISLGMIVTEPGDWIRVITKSQPVEASAAPTIALFALALAFLGFRRKA